MKKLWIAFALVFMVSFSHVEAATTTLDQDTEMHPQGWIAGSVVFKHGTEVALNDKGEVMSGTLRDNTFLKPAGHASLWGVMWVNHVPSSLIDIYFKGDTAVVFNEQGEVVSGTLADDAVILIDGRSTPFVFLKPSTPIIFNSDRSLSKGTIKHDEYLRPVGWENGSKENAGFIKYKAGTELTFNNKGEVVAAK